MSIHLHTLLPRRRAAAANGPIAKYRLGFSEKRCREMKNA
jgi:hypothetical protein